MRSSALRKIFEVMVTNDETGVFSAQPYPRHSRIAIRVGEIDVPTNENIRVIRTPRRQNQRAQNQELESDECEPSKSLHKVDNPEIIGTRESFPESQIETQKSKMKWLAKLKGVSSQMPVRMLISNSAQSHRHEFGREMRCMF